MDIIFADLTHTGHNCNAVPYGIALVAAYAMEQLGPDLTVSLVKKPAELAAMLESREPGMVCFSTFVWNGALSREFARRIKARFPECIIVFGGPHYPANNHGQLAYLHQHPEIDFFVHREGEEAFVRLYRALKGAGFSAKRLKARGTPLPGCHYCQGTELVAAPPLPPIDPLDSLPSPYLAGLCDRYLRDGHTAVMQTVRGCPFSCTYCQEGDDYFNVVRRYGDERLKRELHHIATRAKSPTLLLADSNFGMYDGDLQTAAEMAKVQGEHGWPEFVVSISGKNNKERVLRTAATIRGGMFSAAIQSSDPDVLDNIRRRNVSISELIEAATEQDLHHTHSFSELIVALPGDTLTAHCTSAAALIDAGIHVVRSHQLLMLPGAEVASRESREKFGLQTRFRVIHNTVSPYRLFGETFYAPEVDEVCVASNTMSFQDYLDCRCFDLTVEIFYNNGVFAELHALLKQLGLSVSAFVMQLNGRVWQRPSLARLYTGFLEDTRELWETREELDDFLGQPGVLERYRTGELGRNEQLAYKALALFEKMDDLICLAYETASEQLALAGCLSPEIADYLDQLRRFDLLRKLDPLATAEVRTGLFHYDFPGLIATGFSGAPGDYRLDGETPFLFCHSDKQRHFILEMEALLKSGLHGYATVISVNPKIREYFRELSPAGRSSAGGSEPSCLKS